MQPEVIEPLLRAPLPVIAPRKLVDRPHLVVGLDEELPDGRQLRTQQRIRRSLRTRMQVQPVQPGMRRVYNEDEEVMHHSSQHAQLEAPRTNGGICAVQIGLHVQRLAHLEHEVEFAVAIGAQNALLEVTAGEAEASHD